MTFRQVLDIVWRRKLLVLVVTVLVAIAALLYARLAPVTYASTVTLRYSPAGTSTLSGSSHTEPSTSIWIRTSRSHRRLRPSPRQRSVTTHRPFRMPSL